MDFKKTKAKLKELTGSKKERATALFQKVEFMDAELQKLQEILKEKGWTENYQNGSNQFGMKKSSEADVYNTLIKNYTSAMKQLDEMLPEDTTTNTFLEDMKRYE